VLHIKIENISGNFIIRNMSNNSDLKRLHIERMARLGKARLGKAVAAEADEKTPFECPVCYTDGAEFGLASPACGHQVCLSCYSNILLRTTDDAKCPCCRKPYFKPAVNPAIAEMDPYYGLPPLISAEEASYHWFTSITTTTTTTNGVQGSTHLMNIIADMGVLSDSLDDLIEPPEQQTMN
jgi:hypothetical protein